MSRDTSGPHQGEPKPGIQPPAPMVFNGITTALWGLTGELWEVGEAGV